MVEYIDNGDLACFDGKSFRRDKKTGYFLSSKPINGKRKRLHVYVWEFYNGDVEKGYQIHHKDGNKMNNEIDNLMMMSKKEHINYHAKNISETTKAKLRKNLIEKAIPKAKAWHSSPEGLAWHSEHGKEIFKNLEYKEYVCTNCGKIFATKARYSDESNRFCCNACKSAYRRKIGVDDVKKICEVCGNEYTENKYKKTTKCPECRHKKHNA